MQQEQEELRRRVREYKEKSLYTYKAISSLAGINYSTLRNWLSGATISLEKQSIIAAFLATTE